MADAIAYISPTGDELNWKTALEKALGPIDYRTLDDLGDISDIEVALAWKPAAGILQSFPNLKMIVSLGMGVDHLMVGGPPPEGVPITRIIDEGLIGQMSEYAIYCALKHHRHFGRYASHQKNACWRREPLVDTISRRVGIMGMGAIGLDAARKFALLGFPTAGWSRTAKSVADVETFSGPEEFNTFLARSDILVNVLPLTDQTSGILDASVFTVLPKGAYFINMGRGAHVVEADLLDALETTHLSGASLDVFDIEPLPSNHPFWGHPRINVTPHIAGFTNARTASPGVIENIKRLKSGTPLLNVVDLKAGY